LLDSSSPEKRQGGEDLHALAEIPIATEDIIEFRVISLAGVSGILSSFESPYSAAVASGRGLRSVLCVINDFSSLKPEPLLEQFWRQ